MVEVVEGVVQFLVLVDVDMGEDFLFDVVDWVEWQFDGDVGLVVELVVVVGGVFGQVGGMLGDGG